MPAEVNRAQKWTYSCFSFVNESFINVALRLMFLFKKEETMAVKHNSDITQLPLALNKPMHKTRSFRNTNELYNMNNRFGNNFYVDTS